MCWDQLIQENDDWDILYGPSVPTFDIVDDPMEPMDPIYPPPSDPPTRKRPLQLSDTLQNDQRNVPIRRSFKERRKACSYQGYNATMSTMIQVKLSSFKEVVKEKVQKDVLAEEYESIVKNDMYGVL